jgi:ABC-type Fe3+-siderophore transport system permease subunit
MYPFLTGFWISAGASTGIIFVLMYLHQAHPGSGNYPSWMFPTVSLLIYAAPLIGLAFAWHKYNTRRHRETTRSSLRRRLGGAIVGTIIIIITASLLLPYLWS